MYHKKCFLCYLLRAQPAELPLVVDLVKPGAHVGEDIGELLAEQEEPEGVNTVADYLVPPAQREGETEPLL